MLINPISPNSPIEQEKLSTYAAYIRSLKSAFIERMELEHNMSGEVDTTALSADGTHKFITIMPFSYFDDASFPLRREDEGVIFGYPNNGETQIYFRGNSDLIVKIANSQFHGDTFDHVETIPIIVTGSEYSVYEEATVTINAQPGAIYRCEFLGSRNATTPYAEIYAKMLPSLGLTNLCSNESFDQNGVQHNIYSYGFINCIGYFLATVDGEVSVSMQFKTTYSNTNIVLQSMVMYEVGR